MLMVKCWEHMITLSLTEQILCEVRIFHCYFDLCFLFNWYKTHLCNKLRSLRENSGNKYSEPKWNLETKQSCWMEINSNQLQCNLWSAHTTLQHLNSQNFCKWLSSVNSLALLSSRELVLLEYALKPSLEQISWEDGDVHILYCNNRNCGHVLTVSSHL